MKNFNDFIEQAAAKVLTTESAKNCPKGNIGVTLIKSVNQFLVDTL